MARETSQLGQGDLREQLLEQCRAMAHHAFAAGLKVPGGLVQALDQKPRSGSVAAPEREAVPSPDAGADPDGLSTRDLALLHGRLAEIVAPATPRAIMFRAREKSKGGFLSFLGPVRLVRFMMLVAIACLAGFVWVSLSPEVDADPSSTDPLASGGMKLLLNELFLLFAAGLGASFAALFKVSGYIAARSYDPIYEATYWVRFLLGLISGLVLATLVQIDFGANGPLGHIGGKPTLALLGGFSSDLVHRVLTRLIESVETLVRGDTKQRAAVQEERTKARFEQQSNVMRMDMAAKVVVLQRRLSEGAASDEVQEKLRHILAELVPVERIGAADAGPSPDGKPPPPKDGAAKAKDKSEKPRAGQTEGDGKSEASEAAE